ncbi:hypothetical protein [Maribacter ulvicola]|uniref:Uncharacterized protein n=1 Tax=Maribacter ulvicola TaxID=228959 RepID=A0A1N6YJD0_9FLAO|nr:hypothetical protein [Maribacter ulvicola]SIR14606.1 hypothetical protein SAMN05421797_10713 [Maribacter ulvicola]
MSEQIAVLYELGNFNYLGPFSDLMFENNFYTVVALYTLPMVLVCTFLYYYVFDRPKTSKLWVWSLWLLTIGIIAFVIAYVTVENSFYEVGQLPKDYTVENLIFSATNMVYACIIMFLFSLLIKWKSTNSSHVPF